MQVELEEIPMGRLHAIRLAVIGTFAFYGVMHLLQGSAEIFPIHFLKTFLFFLSIIGLAVAWKAHAGGMDVSLQHWALAFSGLPLPLFFTLHLPQNIDATFAKSSLIFAKLIARPPLRWQLSRSRMLCRKERIALPIKMGSRYILHNVQQFVPPQ